MTGKTHRQGGMLCALVGFLFLKWNNYLLSNVSSILQLLIIYPFAMWGSVASDLDHHWDSCPDKNVPNYIINRLLHITTPIFKKLNDSLSERQKKDSFEYKVAKLFSANHRSWQTHSDLTLIIAVFCLLSSLKGKIIVYELNDVEVAIMSLALSGVVLGIIAHFILDMLTPSGVWFTIGILINKILKHKILPEKLRFVPKSKRFATGGEWENFIRGIVRKATIVATVILITDFICPEVTKYALDWVLVQLQFIYHWFTSFKISIS